MRLPILSVRTLHKSFQFQWFLWTWSPSGRWWNSRADGWLRHAIEGVLGMLSVVLLASFWMPHTRIASRTPISRSASSPVLTPAAMADKIVAAHLFGQVPAQTPATVPAAQSITVDGIVYASGSDDSEAVLTMNGKTNMNLSQNCRANTLVRHSRGSGNPVAFVFNILQS